MSVCVWCVNVSVSVCVCECVIASKREGTEKKRGKIIEREREKGIEREKEKVRVNYSG